MRVSEDQERPASLRADIVGLLLASLAFIAILSMAIIGREAPALAGVDAGRILLLAVGVGAVAFVGVSVGLLIYSVRESREAARRAQSEAVSLRKALLAAEAAVRSEPHVLIFWEQGGGPHLVTHTLESVTGLPRGIDDLLRFNVWLEPDAARELRQSLDALFKDGRSFNLLLRTLGGGHVEADGRAAGARAVLKVRDVAGQKRDLARIVDQQRRLARDIVVGRALFDAMPMPVWIRAADGRLDWVNAAYATAVEAKSPAEACADQLELLETRQRRDVDDTLAKGRTYDERIHIMVGGERRAYGVLVIPLDGASAGVAIDVAALETAEGELSRQTAANEDMLDRVSSAVAIFDREQKLAFCNAAFRSLWKLDEAWLAGKPRDGEVLDRLREQRLLPESANYREFRKKALSVYTAQDEKKALWYLPDGRSVHRTAIPRPDGGIAYLYDDVSEKFDLRRQAELMVHVQKETLDHLKEAVAVFATDGRLKLFNPSFTKVWHLDAADLAREPHIDDVVAQMQRLFGGHDIWQSVKQAVTHFSETREPAGGQMQRADGTVVDFALLPLPDGATLLSFADVTDSKRVERVLTERNEALIAADRLKNQFISHVSYELRTPLQSISGFAEMLTSPRTGLLTERQREYVNAILASSDTLRSVINGILDLATIDAGAMTLKPESIPVSKVLDEVAASTRDRLVRAGQTLEVKIAEGVEDIVADKERLVQILQNLVANASGFSDSGKLVRLECAVSAGQAVFTVEDEGVGISQDDLPKIFERFVTRPNGAGHRGAGLGLPLVKSLVELHGGSVSLDSKLGKGTKVLVTLPVHGKMRLAPAASETATDDAHGASGPLPGMAKSA